MRDGWRETTLGEVATTVAPSKTPAGERYVGLEHFDSGSPRIARWGTTDDVLSATTPFEPGDVLFSKLRPYLRKVAVADQSGRCTTEVLVYRPTTPDVTARYLGLLLQSEVAISHADSSSVGSRMPRTSTKIMAGFRVTLPSLDEQRRIVDLVGAVDDAIEAAGRQIAEGIGARAFLLEGLLAKLSDGAETKPLGECGEFVRGRRFVKSDYVEDGLGCIHYGQIHTHFGAIARETLTFLPESMRSRMRLARKGDVVVAATSEDMSGLGKATVWLGEGEVAVHDDAQIFRHRLDPRFATHLFASETFHRQKVQFAAGTKVTRISGRDLARIVVPVPDPAAQESVGGAMSAFDESLNLLTAERDRLRALRSDMLSILLSGDHEIPASYDDLLEAT